MTRRKLLIFGSILSMSPYLQARRSLLPAKTVKEVEKIIAAVQEHFFPEGSQIPSAKSMNVTQFLFETIGHKSYDKDIRAFVIEGAKELQQREKTFLDMTAREKEKALRAYEETNYGSNWLSRIMTLTMEGLFSDPIYGANVKEAGWKAINTYGGQPRPQTRYAES